MEEKLINSTCPLCHKSAYKHSPDCERIKLPFQNELEERKKINGSEHTSLRELQQHPELIVKEWSPWSLRFSENPGTLISNSAEIKNYLQRIKTAEPAIAEHLPYTDFVIGPNQSGGNSIYIIQDKIQGVSLDQVDREKNLTEIQYGLKIIIRAALKRFIQTYTTDCKGEHLEFGKPENYIWGKNLARKETRENLYLVDTTPLFRSGAIDLLYDLEPLVENFNLAIKDFEPQWSQIEKLRSEEIAQIADENQTIAA